MAPSHGVHDHSRDFIDIFSSWLHRIPRTCGRKIDGVYSARNRAAALFRDVDFAHPARVRDVALGDFNAHSSVSPPLGSASAYRALDDANLALCFNHRCACLSNALQMVSSAKPCTWTVVDV